MARIFFMLALFDHGVQKNEQHFVLLLKALSHWHDHRLPARATMTDGNEKCDFYTGPDSVPAGNHGYIVTCF